jgi:hypothetical protein
VFSGRGEAKQHVIASEAKQHVIASEAKQSQSLQKIASSQSADSAEPIGRELRAERLVAGSQ